MSKCRTRIVVAQREKFNDERTVEVEIGRCSQLRETGLRFTLLKCEARVLSNLLSNAIGGVAE